MDSISSRIEAVSPSLTLAVTNQAKAMKARGEEVYGLAGGEPEVDTPDFIKAAAIKALQEGRTKYTPSGGILELREALSAKLLQDNNLNYDAKQICVTAGAKMACFNAILAIVEEGDEVIIPSPYWVSYPEMVHLAGGKPVIVETKESTGWKITAAQFEAAMTPATKMIILNSPSNPTGAVYSEEELREIGDIALSEDIIILSDEIYEKLVYDDAKHISIATLSKESLRPDDHRQRLLQGVFDDRFAASATLPRRRRSPRRSTNPEPHRLPTPPPSPNTPPWPR